MIVLGGERVTTLGRSTVGIVEMHLHELAGDVVQRFAVVADKAEVCDRGAQHPAADEFEREMSVHVGKLL